MLFTYLLGFVLVYWVSFALFAYYKVTGIFRKYSKHQQIEVPEKWKGFIRTDFQQWDKEKIVQGCFTKFPGHLFMLGSFFILLVVSVYSCKIWKKGGSWFAKFVISTWGMLACHSVANIRKQFDPTKVKQTAIVISNHVCWFETVYLAVEFFPISFVAKAAVKSIPVVGVTTEFLDSIFVERTSVGGRKQSFIQIQDRVNRFNQQTASKRVNQLLIFPEGTTSNGKSILEFKKGAFESLNSITILALIYQCDSFCMGMDEITTAEHYYLSSCLTPTLRVKRQLIEPNEGQSVQQYKEKCQAKLSLMTGFPRYDAGYKEMLEYEALRKYQLSLTAFTEGTQQSMRKKLK